VSNLIERHVPCPCGKSSDAFCVYDNGHSHCFSCGNHTYPNDFPERDNLEGDFTYEFLPWRGVTKETMAAYGALTKIDSQGKPVVLGFPYSEDTFKIRRLDKKEFFTVGAMSEASLFGQSCFQAGQSKAVTITEGELDALSVYQMLGSKFPVVSVRGATSAKKDCTKQYEWLNSFDKIYLCFDNDEPGQKAVKEIATLFDFNKVYHVKLTQFKDANEFLEKGDPNDFSRVWYNSKRFLPEGIVSSYSEIDAILDEDDSKESVSYPFPTLQDMTYGLRQGECTLFTALEGVGKTEILRAIEFNLLKTTDHNLGIIHLEEGQKRSIKGFAGYDLQSPCHLPDAGISKADIKEAYRRLTGRDDRVHYYSHFGSDDPEAILDRIRFLASACGCRFIFLDHITMVVTGLAEGEQTKVLDYLSTKLAMMVEDLNFGLVFVSHVNDEGLTRGSRNISKVAHTWVHLNRDITSESETLRNTTFMTVRKNRFAGRTGPAGALLFDPSTFIVKEQTDQVELPF
jgi:twinkle protein